MVYLKCLGSAARHFWLLVFMPYCQGADEHQGQPAEAGGREEGPGASGGCCQASAELDPGDVGGTFLHACYAAMIARRSRELRRVLRGNHQLRRVLRGNHQLRRVAEMLQAQRHQDQQAAQQPAQQVVCCGYEADVSGGESE